MLTIAELKDRSEDCISRIKAGEHLTLTEPSLHHKRLFESYRANNLDEQYLGAVFNMRCEQAESQGFRRLESTEMVRLLMGEEHTDTAEAAERQNHEYTYNHLTDTVLPTTSCWGLKPTQWWRMERFSKAWYLPPFFWREKWRIQLGTLKGFKRALPLGPSLLMEETKGLKLFNAYNVLAPVSCWQSDSDVDPILVGSIWRYNLDMTKSEQIAYFFLAQW